MNEKQIQIIEALLAKGMNEGQVISLLVNHPKARADRSDLEEYFGSKKKENFVSSVSAQEEASPSEPSDIASASAGVSAEVDYEKEVEDARTAYEATIGQGFGAGESFVQANAYKRLKEAETRAAYGGLEQYRQFFKDTAPGLGLGEKDSNAISDAAKSIVESMTPQMIEDVNNDADLRAQMDQIKEEYRVGSTIKVYDTKMRRGPEGMQMDTVSRDVTVTEDMLDEQIDNARKKALNDRYYETVGTDAKSQVMDMIPEELKDNEKVLEYLTDKIYTEHGIDLDLDGDGRLKDQFLLDYFGKKLMMGTANLVVGFADAIDYTFTGGDKELAGKRREQQMRANETVMEFSKGISSSLGSGDYYNAIAQMGGALAETAPIIGATAAGGLLGAAAVGLSGGGNAYTEALNDPEYGDSIGGRVGYAVASGVGDFLFAAVGNQIFKTASKASQAATASAQRARIISGQRFTKQAMAAYARRKGLAFAAEGFEEAATEIMTSVVEAKAKGKELDMAETMEAALDAFLIGGVAGVGFQFSGSIHGQSKAMLYARANESATAAVRAEQNAEKLIKEAETTEDPAKKRKILMLADGLKRDAERARAARQAFYDMLQVRHKDSADTLMGWDVEIETLARQLEDESLSPEAKKAIQEQLEAKVKQRVDLERTFSEESLELTADERDTLFENTRKFYRADLDEEIELAQMAVDEHVDREGTEAYDPEARRIAEEQLQAKKDKRDQFDSLVQELRTAQQEVDDVQATDNFSENELSKKMAAVDSAMQALSEATGLSPKAFGGVGSVGAFLDIQDQITLRYSGQWLVDKVNNMDNSALSREDLEGILNSDNWSMLTGENPNGKAVGEKFNARLNERAEKWLKSKGLKYHKIAGRYRAGENSFLVEGMTAKQAAEFARVMGQESVAHKSGLVQADGSVNLFEDGATYGSEVDTDSDFLSVIKDKDGNIISFSFMPSDKFQDSKGNTISENEYSERGKKSRVADEDLDSLTEEEMTDEELDQELEEIEQELKEYLDTDPEVEVTDNTTKVPIGKDGKAGVRAGDQGLTADEARVINRFVSFLNKILPGGFEFYIHADNVSAKKAGMLEGESGVAFRDKRIHLNLEAIKSLTGPSKDGRRVKNFQEVLLEEVGHVVKYAAIKRASNSDLLSGLVDTLRVVSKDGALTKAINRKILEYAHSIKGVSLDALNQIVGLYQDNNTTSEDIINLINNLHESGEISSESYRMLLEEGVEEALSAAASDRGVQLGFADRVRLIFENFIRSVLGVGDTDYAITDRKSFISMVSQMRSIKEGRSISNLMTRSARKEGDTSKSRRSSKEPTEWDRALQESTRRLEERIRRNEDEWNARPVVAPTKIKPRPDGKIVVSMVQDIFKYDIGFKKSIGSERVQRVFEDKWHFVNWWKKATNMGQNDKYSRFLTTDGERIDVDAIKDYGTRRSSKVVGLSRVDETIEKVKTAAKMGIISRVVERRLLKTLEMFNRKAVKQRQRGESFVEFYDSRLENALVKTVEMLNDAAQRTGVNVDFSNTSEGRRSSRTIETFLSEIGVTQQQYDEFMDAAESFFGKRVRNIAVDHQFLGAMIKQYFGVDYDNDSEEDTAEKVSNVFSQIYKRYKNDPELTKKVFGSKDPLEFYANTKRETENLVKQMIDEGDLDMTPEDAMIHVSIVQAIVSQKNGAIDNTMAASILVYESAQDRYSDTIISDVLIDKIERGQAGDMFVNGMVAEDVVRNLRKYNGLVRYHTDPRTGEVDFKAVLEDMAGKGVENETRAQDIFGEKIGAFALNLNGYDNVQTFDTHNIRVLRVGMGRHVDFLQAYESRRARVQEVTGVNSDPIGELRALKGILHEMIANGEYGTKEYVSLARLFNACTNPPVNSFNKKERRIANMVIDKMKKVLGVDGKDVCQLFFADSQIKAVGFNGDTQRYEDFSNPIQAIAKDRLYKSSAVARKRALVARTIYENDMALDALEASLKSASDLVGAKESVDESMERRSSKQIRLFDTPNTQAESHPLFRNRTIEEVGRMKDGRVMNNQVVDEALSTDATSRRIIAKNSQITDGQKVGVRLNLNVMKNTGVPVQTMHDKSASGEALKYAAAVTVKNPKLFVNQNARKKIVTFQENKFPMASVDGEFVSDNLDTMDFSGVKAFFNPFNQNVFVDASGRPIKSASEATIIGNTVILRGDIEYYDFNDPIVQQGRTETEAERAKRIKRGPKYDKALARFEAYAKGHGIEFVDRKDLEEAYDNMPITSKVALSESEVAENMENNQRRASKQVKIRQTAGKSARKYGGEVRKDILENKNNYFKPQVLRELKAELSEKSDGELVEIMSNEGLGRLSQRNDDLGVLASAELINRAVARGDLDAIPAIIEEAAAIGTTAGRLLRHLRELKSASPRGIEAIVKSAVEQRGNRLTDEQTARLQDMAGDLFRLQAEHEDLVRRAIAGEDVDAELKAKTDEVKAAERKLDTFANGVIERGWGQIGTMLIQGNLLTPMSQITNVGANLINAIGKVAVDAIALPIERMINMFGIESPMKRNYSINAYMYGIRKFGSGFVEALDGIITGQEKDVSEWRVHRGFAPFRSLMSAVGKGDLPMGPDGKAPLQQRLKLLVQGTLGIPAEIMFRFLSLGDVPFRRAVEGIELYHAGRAQGLEGDALAQFIKHPTKKARQEAEREGRKLTYQEQTGASKAAEDAVAFFERMFTKAFDWIPGADGRAMAKFLIRSNLPYVRTPANILIDTLTYVSPYIAGPRIMKNLQNGDAREAAQNFGKLVVGSMVSQTAVMLLKEGLISGAIEWDEDEEKNLAYDQFPPNSINVTGLKRFMSGGSSAKQPDDVFISYTKLGVMGAIIGAIVKGTNKEELKKRDYSGLSFPIHAIQDSFGVGAFSSIAYMMDQSFMQGMNTLVDVISSADATDFEKNFENWFRTTFQAVSATVFPNTLSAMYRGTREYLPDTRVTKDMSLSERITQRMAYTIKDRTFGLGDVPIRVNWKGEPIKQTPRGNNGIAYQLFDITKSRQGEADPVSNEIYRLYEQTEDLTKVVGTPGYAEKRKMNVPNIKKKHLGMLKRMNKTYTWVNDDEFMAERVYLNTDQMNRLMAASGKERYKEVEAFMATERYAKMKDDEKIEALNEIAGNYNSAIEIHKGQFRNHTKLVFEIMQEVYDREREEI